MIMVGIGSDFPYFSGCTEEILIENSSESQMPRVSPSRGYIDRRIRLWPS